MESCFEEWLAGVACYQMHQEGELFVCKGIHIYLPWLILQLYFTNAINYDSHTVNRNLAKLTNIIKILGIST